MNSTARAEGIAAAMARKPEVNFILLLVGWVVVQLEPCEVFEKASRGNVSLDDLTTLEHLNLFNEMGMLNVGRLRIEGGKKCANLRDATADFYVLSQKTKEGKEGHPTQKVRLNDRAPEE